MQYPHFYDEVVPIRLYDPLSDFLGAFNEGEIEIDYLDCVKLAGHSCPTVAGAYLLASKGLSHLYKDALPHRGTIKVEIREAERSGVTGVTASILSFIVGAGGEGGFKGIQGHFSRNDLLFYEEDIPSEIRLTRLDTMQQVDLSYDPSVIQANSQMKPLLGKTLQGLASKEEKKMFQTLWQKRVEEILLNTECRDELITIKK